MRLSDFSRVSLAILPTPLQRARNLERALGPGSPRIYLKRDDLIGLAFGGNKARKLEYVVADALAAGATHLVTEGTTQSNHARMTAAAANLVGLDCTLVLDTRFGAEPVGNLLLDRLLGCEIRLVERGEERAPAMEQVAAELRAAGARPYVIPSGASVPLGALGYVAAVEEILAQIDAAGERPGRLYTATSSLGTHAGLAVGARLFAAPFAVIGIANEETTEVQRRGVAALAAATADLLGLRADFPPEEITVDDAFVGAGYGRRTPEGLEAIRLLARTEAVFLDPVYTGKVMAGLISHIRTGQIGPNESVIFLHSGGGPSLFAHGAALLDGA